MRWPFRRRRRSTSEPMLAAPAGAAADERGPAEPSAAWTDLAPLQPTASRLEVTAPSRDFVRELVTQRPHHSSLEPLGHDVSLEGPAGVARIAIAAPPRHHDGEPPDLEWVPVAPVDVDGSPAGGRAGPPPAARRPTVSADRSTRAGRMLAQPAPRARPAWSALNPTKGTVPPRRAAIPPAQTTGRNPDRRPTVGTTHLTADRGLQRAPEEGAEPAPGSWHRNPAASGGIPVPERIDNSETDGDTPGPPTAPAPRATGGSEPAAESHQNWWDSGTSSPGDEATIGEAAVDRTPPVAGRTSPVVDRGETVSGSPDVGGNAEVSRSATAADPSEPFAPGIRARTTPTAGRADVPGGAGVARPFQAAATSTGRLTGSGHQAASSPGASTAPALTLNSVERHSVVAATTTAATVTKGTIHGGGWQGAPIAGHRPLVPTASIRQASATRAVDGIPVHRGREASARARDLGARAYTEDGEIHLPSEAGPLDEEPARSLLAHELVHAHQQRRLGGRLPDEATEEGRRLETEAERAERTASAGGAVRQEPLRLAHRREPGRNPRRPAQAAAVAVEVGVAEGRPDASVVFTPPEAHPATRDPSGTRHRRPPQRAPQRAGEDPGDPAEAGGRGGSDDPGDPGDPGDSEADDVDSLVKKLYPQMLDRLRRDLVVERERAGRLIDRR